MTSYGVSSLYTPPVVFDIRGCTIRYRCSIKEKEMTRPYRACPKCRVHCRLSAHHILPRRFWGKKGNSEIFLLCRACHDELELRIDQHNRLPVAKYYRILLDFLSDV